MADSTLPAVCLSYTMRNTGNHPITATIAGWTDSPINLDSRGTQPIILRSKTFQTGEARGVEFSGAPGQLGAPREDILFEDWERGTYAPWTVEGTAFGPGPLTRAEMSAYMKGSGDMHITGDRFVTSQNFRGPAGDTQKADDETGKLTSPPFIVSRRYVAAAVGGGAWIGEACLNVIVSGQVVASFTGANAEPMLTQWYDVSAYEGKTATIEIVDSRIGGWGHVNCDRIWFTDKPAEVIAYEDLPDHGTFALAALESDATVKPSIANADSLDAIFDGIAGPTEVAPGDGTITAAVSVPVHLRPGQTRTVRFAVVVLSQAVAVFLRGAGLFERTKALPERLFQCQQGDRPGRRQRWRRRTGRDSPVGNNLVCRFDTAALVPGTHSRPRVHARDDDLSVLRQRSVLRRGGNLFLRRHLPARVGLCAVGGEAFSRVGALGPGDR
ncbi:hypothetical protein [Fodinicola feengrottensis]|uniref:hypothetical protein n=1 Tax=Fodinicola feengrottensis TaxID=435914 RepID=UPI0013D5A1B3|nr:hypothetical protein [Fodinicola feengrottensis]